MPIGTLPITNTTINGNILTLTFNVILDQNNLPNDESVVITVAGQTALMSSGFASSNQLVLTLDTVMQPGTIVTFAYTDPTSGDDAEAFQDSAGNDIGSFNVAAFIASSHDSGTLFDINNDGSFDWMQLVETWTDQQSIVRHDDAVYRVVADSGDSYTAQNYMQFTFGSTYDADDRPLIYLDEGNDCTITWQERDSDGVVATAPISFYMEVNGVDTEIDGTFKFIDANNNGKPDQLEVVYPDSANPSQYLYFASGDITDYTYSLAGRPISFGAVTTDEAGGSSDLFNFTLTGGAAAPTAISLPSDGFKVDNQQPSLLPQYARVDGNQLILPYNELLDSAHRPAATAFSVKVNGTVVGISNVAVVENKVVLTLNTVVASGASVTFSYTDPTSSNDLYALQDISGNDASSQSNFGAGGGSTDTMPPVLQSAQVSGHVLTLMYNENLGIAPLAGAFTVRMNGNTVGFAGPSILNNVMTFQLFSEVQAGQTVMVSYTDPTTGNDVSALQDYTGNDAASFTGYGVTNNTVSGSNVPWVTNVYAENESTPDNHDSAVLRVTDRIGTYVEMSSAVTVTGTPRLALLTGSTTHTVYATYDALSSTSTRLAFHYDLQNGDLGQLAVSAFDFTNGSSIATTSGSVQTAINRNLQPDFWVYGASVANGTSGNDVVAISIPAASTVEVIRTALSGISDGGGNHDVLELSFVASSDNAKMSGTDSADRIDGTIDGYSVAIVKESNNINFYIADQFVKTLSSSVNGGFERLVINLLNAQGSVLESSGDIRLSSGFFSGLLGGSHYYGSDFSDLITVQNDASSWHYIETYTGNDTVIGSSGNDTCNISGDGNKSISLGDGNDVINWWSAGNSTIDGGAGSDDLYVSLDTSSGALSWMLKDDGEVHVYSGSVEIATIQNAGTSYLFTASSNHGEQIGDMIAKVSNVEYCTFIDADERTGQLKLAEVFAGGGSADTTLPTIISATPSDNATIVPVGSNIVLTFSEAIQRGSGTIEIHTGSVTGQLVAANLTLIGNILTINPNNELANNTHYFVSLSNGSIKDLAGNPYAGTTAYDFTTVGAVSHNSATFLSGGGIVTTDFGGRDFGKSIVLQSDGKIVVVGESSGGGDGGFAVVRYNADGSLDASFDGDGTITTDFGGLEYATSAALQSDGKIVVAGYNGISSSGGGDFALVRYNADGSFDTTFDGDGKVTTNLGGREEAESVTVESDGKIVVAGYTGISSSGGGDFAVVRYNSNGSLDTSFGANGKVITNVGVEDYVHSLIVQSDHKIVVIGESGISSSGGSDFALVRYNADGSLDTTFGVAGKVITDFDLGDYVGGAAVQPDGKILVVGESFSSADMAVSGGQDFVIVRYNTDGTLDTSFDSDGKIVADFGGSDSAHSVTLQSDGKIVVTGSSSPAGGSGGGDVIVVRYNTNGTLDTTFSGDGIIKTAIGDESEGNSVVVQSDGKILVAGASASTSSGNPDFLLVRYNADGSMAPGIDFDGIPVGTPSSYESFTDLYVDASYQNLPGYIGSALVELSPPGVLHCFDEDHDGIADHFTRTWTDATGTQSISGTTIWLDKAVFKSSGSALIGGIPYSINQYGRVAYDAQGDVVGLYFLAANPVFTLTPDTTAGDALIATFTIPNQTGTWSLLDSDLNGVVDKMTRVESRVDSNNVQQTNTAAYAVTWSDATNWTAYMVEKLMFGSTYDSDGRPTTVMMNGAYRDIIWHTSIIDHLVATVSFTEADGDAVIVTFFDSNPIDSNLFDKVVYKDEKNEVHADLDGLNMDGDHLLSAKVVFQSSTWSEDIFSGTITGTSSNPETIIMPSYFMGSNGNQTTGLVSNITINTTGSVGGAPLANENYYKFYSGTGVIATTGNNGLRLDLMADTDNNPSTFYASWNWLNASGQISETGTGVLTFQDIDTTKAGPEQWSVTLDFNKKNMPLIADGSDAGTAPDGFVVSDAQGNLVNVPLTWQERDANHVIATFTATLKNDQNQDVALSGSLIDDNNDTLPDRAVGYDGSEPFENAVRLVDTNNDGVFDYLQRYDVETLSGRVQVDASGNSAGLYVNTWNGQDTLTNNTLTIDLGTTGASLASSASIIVKLVNSDRSFDTANVAVSSLTFDGTHLTIPLSGTDPVTHLPYAFDPSSGRELFVQIPAGVVVGQSVTSFNAWHVGAINDNSYALSPMTIVRNGAGTSAADWVIGTSGDDSIATGAGDDVLQWSDGNDTIDGGDGYDKLYMSFSSANVSKKIDLQGVFHIGEASLVTGDIVADAYRITRLSLDSYQLQQMDSTGTNVVRTMLLNNAEAIGVGNFEAQYFSTPLTVVYNNESVNGTPWRDTIYLNASSISTLSQVWGGSAKDTLVFDVGAGYSKMEVVNEGSANVLKGTLVSGGTVVDIGHLGVLTTTQDSSSATITIGTGGSAHSFTVNDIEGYHFVSGTVSLDVDPTQLVVNHLPTGSVTIVGTATQGQTLTANTSMLADADGLGTLGYQWKADGAAITGATGSTLALGEAQVGKKITVVTSYTDGHGTPESMSSIATKAVLNVNDVPTGSVSITGMALQGQTLMAHHTLADADGLGAIHYQWQAGGVNIAEATSDTLHLGAAQKGKAITLQAWYVDGHGTAEHAGSAPTGEVAGFHSGIAQDGYLSNALVWVDDNGNKVLDWTDADNNGQWDPGEGESWTLTDGSGQFTGLVGDGTLRITANPIGGATNPELIETIDISTGKPFTGSYSAPSGSTVVNPLTTLVVAAGGDAAAADTVKTALGLDSNLDLSTYDALAEAAKTGSSGADVAMAIKVQSAATQIANIMDIASGVAEGSGTNGANVATDVAHALINGINEGVLDLTNTLVIQDAIAATTQTAIESTVLGAIGDAAALLNDKIQQVSDDCTATAEAGGTVNANESLKQVVSTQLVAQDTSAQATTAVSENNSAAVTVTAQNIDIAITEKAAVVQIIFTNHAPTGDVTITGVAAQDQILTAHHILADIDGLGEISYKWQVLDNTAWSDITGAICGTLELGEAQVGRQVRVVASYTDDSVNHTHESMNSIATPLVVPPMDVTLPTMSTFSPEDAGTNVAIGSDIALTFSEEIQKGAGLIEIHSGSASGVVMESFDAATSQQLTIAGKTLTINPTTDLANNEHYFITFNEGAIKDLAGNSYSGTDSYDFTTAPAFSVHHINGMVTFWKTAATIGDVTSTLTSSSASEIPSASMTDALAGLYQHLDMPDGTYALTNAKISGAAESSAIKANDALAALKIAVGMNPNADGSPVSSYQFLAADVNHDGQVKAADALNILKMAVKLSTAPEKEWLFVPESVGSETMSRTSVHWPDNAIPVTLDVDQELHLIGIVKGDVNGSWVG
jgi:uncharacterized delta-60 repeat protein/uncharacterized repeat protein (TIGR02059 family)